MTHDGNNPCDCAVQHALVACDHKLVWRVSMVSKGIPELIHSFGQQHVGCTGRGARRLLHRAARGRSEVNVRDPNPARHNASDSMVQK
jgi:hypothetical protein